MKARSAERGRLSKIGYGIDAACSFLPAEKEKERGVQRIKKEFQIGGREMPTQATWKGKIVRRGGRNAGT